MSGRPTTIRIDDLNDPRVAAYRNVRDADLIRDRGSFMAEGRFVLAALTKSTRFPVKSVLLNDAALEQMTDVIAELPESTPVYAASQGVMDAIVGFHIHRGCLAEGDRGTPLTPARVLDLAADKPVLLLEDLTNHDNVGGIFRTALALGAGGALLTTRCADPLYRKAIRVSMGAALQLPWAAAPLEDLLAALRADNRTIIATALTDTATDLRDLHESDAVRNAPKHALLLGAEGHGLTPEALSAAHVTTKINITPNADSLNVTTAAAITLYELTRN